MYGTVGVKKGKEEKMKRKKSYRFDKIVIEICEYLSGVGEDTPASIAKSIEISPRTAQKYINYAINLGLFIKREIRLGKNKVNLIKINPKYKEIFDKIKNKMDGDEK